MVFVLKAASLAQGIAERESSKESCYIGGHKKGRHPVVINVDLLLQEDSFKNSFKRQSVLLVNAVSY